MRENKPLLRTEGGAGDPREGVPNASHHSPGTPRGRRGLHSQTGRTIAACLDPGRPGLGLPPAPQARVVSAPPAPARPRLGPRPAARAEPRPGRACNPGPARPPLPRPHVHSRAGGARSPGAVAALAHSATLLAARPRDTRTAPARPGPGWRREGAGEDAAGSAHARKPPSDQCGTHRGKGLLATAAEGSHRAWLGARKLWLPICRSAGGFSRPWPGPGMAVG